MPLREDVLCNYNLMGASIGHPQLDIHGIGGRNVVLSNVLEGPAP